MRLDKWGAWACRRGRGCARVHLVTRRMVVTRAGYEREQRREHARLGPSVNVAWAQCGSGRDRARRGSDPVQTRFGPIMGVVGAQSRCRLDRARGAAGLGRWCDLDLGGCLQVTQDASQVRGPSTLRRAWTTHLGVMDAGRGDANGGGGTVRGDVGNRSRYVGRSKFQLGICALQIQLWNSDLEFAIRYGRWTNSVMGRG